MIPGETSQSSSLNVGVGVGGIFSNGDSADSLSESDATLSDCSQRTAMHSSSSSSKELKLNRLPSIICSTSPLSERNVSGSNNNPELDVGSQEFPNDSFMILSPHRLSPLSLSSHDSNDDISVFYRPNNNNSTIEVPVLDAINAHKYTANNSNSNESMNNSLLNPPPMILLEIPSGGGGASSSGAGANFSKKCLSPIHEMPTPTPSPLLTPIMTRPRLMANPSLQAASIHPNYPNPVVPLNNRREEIDESQEKNVSRESCN